MPEDREPYPEEALSARLLAGRGGKLLPPTTPNRFLSICGFHGISSLILRELETRNITGNGWDEIRQALEDQKRQWLARNIYLLNRLRRFGSMMRKAGIPSIVLKGGSLLGVLYTDFGMRPLSDVDVLVRRSDLKRILGLLRGDGWVIPSADQVAYWKRRFYHLSVRTDDAFSAELELHWNLEKELRHSIELEELWERALAFRLEGDILYRLSNEDLALHLLVHLAHHYFNPRVIWAYDIRQLARRSSLDWDRILARAERWRLRVPMYYSLLFVEKVFPGVLPDQVLESARIGWFRRALLLAVGTANPLALTAPLASPVLRLPFSLFFIDRPIDMARYTWRNLGPKLGDWVQGR